MPVVVQQLEAGIFYTHWQGVTRKERFVEEMRARLKLVDTTDEPAYVLVIDLSQALVSTSSLRAVQETIALSPRLVQIVLYGASNLAGLVKQTINSDGRQMIDVVETFAAAVLHARASLADAQAQL